jgi:hypothetical protein
MADKPTSRSPYAFTPVILDQESHEKRRIIKQLPGVHQTETLTKFFGASADHLFDPGKGKPINGYVGQKPLWYDPDQDYYLEEGTTDRTFYQLEASMVSKNTEGALTDLLPYPDLINQLRFQGALTNNHNLSIWTRLSTSASIAGCLLMTLNQSTHSLMVQTAGC